jgi:hypothetical protein
VVHTQRERTVETGEAGLRCAGQVLPQEAGSPTAVASPGSGSAGYDLRAGKPTDGRRDLADLKAVLAGILRVTR